MSEHVLQDICISPLVHIMGQWGELWVTKMKYTEASLDLTKNILHIDKAVTVALQHVTCMLEVLHQVI